MKMVSCLALFAACVNDQPEYVRLTEVQPHRCSLGRSPRAVQGAASTYTGLDYRTSAPPRPWPLQLHWDGAPIGETLPDQLEVHRPESPDALMAYDVDSPRGGCSTGAVLDAGYNVSWSLGTSAGAGVLWTRTAPDNQPDFLEFRFEIPLSQAPESIQLAAEAFPDPERPHATAALVVLDRAKGREVTWLLQRNLAYDFSERGLEVVPRQWLLARGTWTEGR
jgi:hypothetical protein